MRAQQSKFLASINSTANDGLDGSKSGETACPSDIRIGPGESTQDVCSLCHDPSSKNPLSFLILLQVSDYLACVIFFFLFLLLGFNVGVLLADLIILHSELR